MKNKVSIIIPTFNRANLVGMAISSALAQTRDCLEVIVVDDGSVDDTENVVAGFADARVIYHRKPNGGLASARNVGIQASTGEYLCFLDDDDVILPHKLAVQVAALEQDASVGLVASGHRYVDADRHVLGESRPWLTHPSLDLQTWLLHCPFVTHGMCVRREWLKVIDGFDEQLTHREDWDCWLRLADAGCRMSWVKDIVCDYQLSHGTLTSNTRAMESAHIALLTKFYSRVDLSGNLFGIKAEVFANAYLSSASRHYACGLCSEGRASVGKALDLYPPFAKEEVDRAVDLLLGEARIPYQINDLASFGETIAKNLPDPGGRVKLLGKRLRSQAAIIDFFEAFAVGDWKTINHRFLAAVRLEPRWLLNRGVLSIWVQSLSQLIRLDGPRVGIQ